MWRILCLTVAGVLSIPVQTVASPARAEHSSTGLTSPVAVVATPQIRAEGCGHSAELLATLNSSVQSLTATPPTSLFTGISVAQAKGPDARVNTKKADLKKPQAPLPVDKVIAQKTATMRIDVHYPELGIPPIDTDISQWAVQLVENFQTEFEGETAEIRTPYDLNSTYTLLRPATDTAVTVVWEIASYTQGAHGNRDIVTSTYSLPDGQPLGLGELFIDLGTALNLMSEAAYTRLSRSLGDMLNDDMVRGGTTPDPDNFSSFALVPGAIRIFFQPYQVAPWAAGPQQVDIPLEELEDAGPQYQFWGGKKQEVSPPL